ncbi:transcription factor 7-like 1-B [Simochromis diagramma]|uniref:transcription factor 7-like 1-B n=1 Tax=Simochromis diagramma TaxID=43689 RepID=UPI001A7EBD1D|nr:transcription factor 7-like 1-B [Simochromis diagramma]
MAGNRTRVNCLESSYARHYTTIAVKHHESHNGHASSSGHSRQAGDEPPKLATPVSEHIQDEDGPYVKKPPNAFMLYLKEQRPKVIAELNIPGSAAVNAVVGQRWKSLSNDQKARYFKQAETERQNHAKEHPAWSTKENYGKKRKRIRLRKGERRFLGITASYIRNVMKTRQKCVEKKKT